MGIVAYAGSQLLILVVLLKSGGFRAAGDFSLSQAISFSPGWGLALIKYPPQLRKARSLGQRVNDLYFSIARFWA